MLPDLRRDFNARFDPSKYRRFLGLLQERAGVAPDFPHNETPCFLSHSLVEKLSRYGTEMTTALLADPGYRTAAEAAVPIEFDAPNEAARPLFVQVDFGLDQDLEPRLVEIQGFPSLYAYQPLMSLAYQDTYEIPLPYLPGGLSLDAYKAELRAAIVGSHDPENVILLEVDPWHQKTLPDFLATQQLLGIAIIDISTVIRHGNRLFYQRHGKEVPIHRIYNRAIAEEIQRRRTPLPFQFRDELAVEWAGHPNWFFKLSKFSLPYLRHASVPWTRFLDEAGELPDLNTVVLKPLYSFAGSGVVIGPTREQIQAIPLSERHNYVLQEKIDFRPVIETPFGLDKIEIRMMYIWDREMKLMNMIIRTGRGAMMGVDHNKGLQWVGASAAFLA